jgi:hypothetical protein
MRHTSSCLLFIFGLGLLFFWISIFISLAVVLIIKISFVLATFESANASMSYGLSGSKDSKHNTTTPCPILNATDRAAHHYFTSTTYNHVA